MGLFLLGLRSLFLRLAVFVVFAALFVWFLGGNLTANAARRNHDSVACGGQLVRVVQMILPIDSLPSELETWHVEATSEGDDDWEVVANNATLVRATELTIAPDGGIWFAGASSGMRAWTIYAFDCTTRAIVVQGTEYRNRADVERQLARVALGLTLQSPETIDSVRDNILRQGD